MKRFQFDDLWILSKKERRGIGLDFHPRRNLLFGGNHTGKSTLIKTLFTTLGATPTGKLGKWDTHATSAVRFTVGDTQFRAVHDSGRRGLFDSEGNLLGVATKGDEWTRIFAEVVDFNLALTSSKTGAEVRANPGCFFLPFYIDQDSGWTAGWEVFQSTKAFRAPIPSVLEYFSGIRPPDYYAAKAQLEEVKLEIAHLEREMSFLKKAQARFDTQLPLAGPKMDPDNFTHEIGRLSEEMTRLNISQEKLREKATKERDLIDRLTYQIAAAQAALKDYDGDTKYLRTLANEPLICPVCHAEHAEPYLDLLAFADDARSLRSLMVDFDDERQKCKDSLRGTNQEIQKLESSYREIEAILAVRRGDLEFRQIVESRGAEQAQQAFAEEHKKIDDELDVLASRQRICKSDMDKWADTKRKKGIVDNFKTAYSAALFDLNLPNDKATGLQSRPKLSGSGGPRAILAYYSALWSVCLGPTGTFGNSIVVDTPNQQGQDAQNLPKVLEYVALKLPGKGQVIVGSEIAVDHEFDRKIVLDRAYQVLSDDYFAAAEEQINPLLDKLYSTAT